MNLSIPKWALYVAGGLFALVIAGFVWNWYHPAPGSTIAAAKPVVQTAAPTRLEVKETKPETVARQVVRRVPVAPKVKEQIEHDFDVRIATEPDRPAKPGEVATPAPGTVDLLTQVELPQLVNGGTAIAVLDGAGQTKIKVLPKKQPFFSLGGIRESGVFYEVLRGSAGIYHEQDLLRTGQVVWSARAFASVPAPPVLGGLSTDRGFNYGLELRAGIRW